MDPELGFWRLEELGYFLCSDLEAVRIGEASLESCFLQVNVGLDHVVIDGKALQSFLRFADRS